MEDDFVLKKDVGISEHIFNFYFLNRDLYLLMANFSLEAEQSWRKHDGHTSAGEILY